MDVKRLYNFSQGPETWIWIKLNKKILVFPLLDLWISSHLTGCQKRGRGLLSGKGLRWTPGIWLKTFGGEEWRRYPRSMKSWHNGVEVRRTRAHQGNLVGKQALWGVGRTDPRPEEQTWRNLSTVLWTVGLGRIFEIPESMNEVKTNQNKTRKQQQQKQNLFNHFFFLSNC